MSWRRAAAGAAALAVALAARAQESSIDLAAGVGKDKVVAYCSSCHSLDYIQMNSPFPDRKLWEAEVNKMIKVFGAPIPPGEIGAIVDYLTKHYGR